MFKYFDRMYMVVLGLTTIASGIVMYNFNEACKSTKKVNDEIYKDLKKYNEISK